MTIQEEQVYIVLLARKRLLEKLKKGTLYVGSDFCKPNAYLKDGPCDTQCPFYDASSWHDCGLENIMEDDEIKVVIRMIDDMVKKADPQVTAAATARVATIK